MCVNEYVSIAIFMICSITCLYLYKRNRVNDRWVAIVFFYIGSMQLIEFVMWLDQECKGANQIATDIGFWQNIFQPIVSIIVAFIITKGKMPVYFYIPLFAYLFYSLPQIVKAKHPDRCSKPCENSDMGLAWDYTNTENDNIVWLIFLAALAVPFLAMPENGVLYTGLAVATYIVSLFISKNRCPASDKIPTSGSWWCLLGFVIPIIAILDSNSNPENIDFPIPGNDDARRSIDLYCNLIKETIIAAKKTIPLAETKKSSTYDP